MTVLEPVVVSDHRVHVGMHEGIVNTPDHIRMGILQKVAHSKYFVQIGVFEDVFVSKYGVFAGMAQGVAVAHEMIEVGIEEEIVLSQNDIVGDHRGEGQAEESQAQDQLHLLVDLFLRMEFSGGI